MECGQTQLYNKCREALDQDKIKVVSYQNMKTKKCWRYIYWRKALSNVVSSVILVQSFTILNNRSITLRLEIWYINYFDPFYNNFHFYIVYLETDIALKQCTISLTNTMIYTLASAYLLPCRKFPWASCDYYHVYTHPH